MIDPFAHLGRSELAGRKRAGQPEWVTPMKAVLTKDYFSDPEWIYEPKLDGVRCLAYKKGRSVRIYSRNRLSMAASYPEVVDALVDQKGSFILDGEVVAFAGGAPSFSRLQRRIHVADPNSARSSGVEVFYYVFDICHVAGYDVTGMTLLARKKVLDAALDFGDPLRTVDFRKEKGVDYLEEICAEPGWEGLIAKRADSTYKQTRSKDWLKFKCGNEQEFVIGGFTDPQGAREHFGALLVGYYEDGELRYAGKVGTGFGGGLLQDLGAEMRALERESSPFADHAPKSATVHWVEPRLVGQVGFSEWTVDGRLRHPRFMGLRRDKDASEVVRERPS